MTGATARRSSLADVEAYPAEEAAVRVDLSDNTNRWGMSPASEDAIRRIALSRVSRYPEAYADTLKGAIADYLGVPAQCVVTGCGSDDVLDSAIRAFGEPGSAVSILDPTFPMIAKFARVNALTPVPVPLDAAYDVSPDAMLACAPRIAYVCSPNNPTGTLVSRASIEAIAQRIDGVLIVDEAYAEFGGESVVTLAASAPNVLVVRTMSKAFGLAGLRVGYGVGAPALVAEVEKSRGPYKVSVVGAAAATAALGEGLAWMNEHVALAVRMRERLVTELRVRSYEPIASAANFVCVPVRSARDVARGLRQRGVAVRAYSALAPVSPALAATGGDALRISVGPWDEIQAVLDALDAVRAS